MPETIEPPLPHASRLSSANAPIYTYPWWVTESRVLTSDGEVDRSLFAPSIADHVERRLAGTRRDDGCIQYGVALADLDDRRRERLTETIESSKWIFLADVTGLDRGLRPSMVGTLVRVEATEVFKGALPHEGPFFIFLARGELDLGPWRACASDNRYPELPRVGERVLLMLDAGSEAFPTFAPVLGTDQHSGIITFPHGTRVSLPSYQDFPRAAQHTRTLEAMTPEWFIEWLRERLSMEQK